MRHPTDTPPVRAALLAALLLAGPAAAQTAEPAVPPPEGDPAALAERIGSAHGKGDPHKTLDAEQRIRVALQHRDAGRLELAMSVLDEAINQMPRNARLHAVRGSMRLESGQPSAALADLELSLEVVADDPLVLTNRARVYTMFERYDAAIVDLDRAIELSPDLLAARFNRGTLRYQRRDYHGSLQDFDRCVELAPETVAAFFNRAAVLDALGQREAAAADLERVLELEAPEQAHDYARQQLERWREEAGASE